MPQRPRIYITDFSTDGKYTQAVPVDWLRDRTFGIIGLGRIGTAAAHCAKAIGMKAVFYDPCVPDGRERVYGISRSDTLAELLAQAQVLSLHCPATPETIGMIRAEQI
jgi:phosphoglycerate dehydrogenase-like enzyme